MMFHAVKCLKAFNIWGCQGLYISCHGGLFTLLIVILLPLCYTISRHPVVVLMPIKTAQFMVLYVFMSVLTLALFSLSAIKKINKNPFLSSRSEVDLS